MAKESSPELRGFQWIGFFQSALTGLLASNLGTIGATPDDMAAARAGEIADLAMVELAERDFESVPAEVRR